MSGHVGLAPAVVAVNRLVFFSDPDAMSTPEDWVAGVAVRLQGADLVAVTRAAVSLVPDGRHFRVRSVRLLPRVHRVRR